MQNSFRVISTGISGLDRLLKGGFPEGRVYLVCGPPGSGKTTMGMHFLLDGAKNSENGLYISTVEPPKNIVDDISQIFSELPRYLKDRAILFADLGATMESEKHITPVQIIHHITELVKKNNIKRLVIESISVVKNISVGEKIQKYELSRFIRKLKDMGCTTLMLSEMLERSSYTSEQFLVHGVIFLHNFIVEQRMQRGIQVTKMGGVDHTCDIRRMSITGRGIDVHDEKLL